MVKAHVQNRDGTSDAVFGATSLSDMSDEEFFEFKNSLKQEEMESFNPEKIFSHSGSRLPERIDWRENNSRSYRVPATIRDSSADDYGTSFLYTRFWYGS